MTSGGKSPYLDFQKYKHDGEKRSFFSFGSKKTKPKARPLKVYEMPPTDQNNFTVGSNPFRKEIHERINYKKFFSTFFIVFFFVAWFWLIFYLPYFDIDKVSYFGIKALNADEIKSFVNDNYLKSGKYWHRNNYFVVSADKIKEGLKQKFDTSDIQVTKTFPDQLQIDITEKTQSIVYCTQVGYYLLDSDGTAVKTFWEKIEEVISTSSAEIVTTSSMITTSTITNTTTQVVVFKPNKNKVENEYRNLPLLCIDENKKFEKNQKNILSADFLQTVIKWQESLNKEGIGTPEYFIGGISQQSGLEAHLSDKRWYLKISPENIDQQISKIKAILAGNDGGAKANEYIDVRFGDRVFWK